MSEKTKYGISLENGTFGSLNLKDDPSFIEVEQKEEEIQDIINESIKKNKKNLINK